MIAKILFKVLSLLCVLVWLSCLIPIAAANQNTVILGLPPWGESEAMKYKFKPLMQYLSEQLKRPVHLIVTTDYADLERQLSRGDIDIAFMPASSYVKAKQTSPDLNLLARYLDKHPVTGKVRDHYHGVIVTLSAANIKNLHQLKGKRFGYTDVNSSSGYLYPKQLMVKQGIDPQKHFSQVFMLQKHPKVTQALLNAAIDAGATWDVNLARMQARHPGVFRVIARTSAIPLAAVVASADLNPDTTAQIKQLLLQSSKKPKLLNKLQSNGLNIMGWVETSDQHFDSVRKVFTNEGATQLSKLTFGLGPSASIYQLNQHWMPLLSYLSNQSGIQVELQTTGDYQQLIKRTKNGQFDVVAFPAYSYVKAKAEIPDLQYAGTLLKAYGDSRISAHYNGVIITLKSNQIRTIAELKGKRFGFTSKASASGYLYPKILLLNENIDPERDFSQVFMLNRHDKVIKSILSQAIDGGAITDNELYLATKAYGDIFTVLAKTQDIPFDALAIAPHLPKKVRDTLKDAISAIVDNQSLLKELQSTGWKYAGVSIQSDDFYNNVRQISQALEQAESP